MAVAAGPVRPGRAGGDQQQGEHDQSGHGEGEAGTERCDEGICGEVGPCGPVQQQPGLQLADRQRLEVVRAGGIGPDKNRLAAHERKRPALEGRLFLQRGGEGCGRQFRRLLTDAIEDGQSGLDEVCGGHDRHALRLDLFQSAVPAEHSAGTAGGATESPGGQ